MTWLTVPACLLCFGIGYICGYADCQKDEYEETNK